MRSSRRLHAIRLIAVAASLAAVAGACSSVASGAAGGVRAASGAAWAQDVCSAVPAEWLQRVANAHRDDWSGDVQFLPNYPNPVDGGLSHAGPWPHLQEVPFLIWGPGIVKPGVYRQPVGLTDIAPTAGKILDFDFAAPDGEALTGALVPAEEREPPKLVVTLVWDSTGLDVLDEWNEDWPFLRELSSQGAWFPNATVGISNSNTPPGHAAIGTGAFPTTNGIVDEYVRIGDRMVGTGEGGPSLVISPMFADVYDVAMGNEPVVGSVVTLASHAFMMSHGAMWNGGDRDITVMRQQIDAETSGVEAVEWNLPGKMRLYYRFPEYANRASNIDAFNRELDQRDGKLDGLWRQNSIEQLRSGFDTPARTPYQTQLIRAVVEREGFGQGGAPDLLYLNYKAIDTIGHAYGMNSVEMQDSVQYQDEALRELVGLLNEQVGEGQWVLFLTADHGAQIPADVTDSIPIDPNKMKKLVIDRFDTDGDEVELFRQIRPTQLWVDMDELDDLGVTFDEIARYIASLTASQVARSDFTIPAGRADELVYQASWPSRITPALPCLPSGDAA